MKKLMIFAALLLFSGIAFGQTLQKGATVENPYEGAWEVIYTKFVYPDTTFENKQIINPSVKLLTKKHFAFGSQNGENQIVGGGGEYTFDGDTYTEHIKYHFYSGMVGNSLKMKSKIEGDLWTIFYVFKDDNLSIEGTETWKRIME
jgi:hypothetical protein